MVSFIAGVTSYKHQGFREECEIRTVTIPASQEVVGQLQDENPGVSLFWCLLIKAN
jgi:hypothetical protein